MERLCINVYNVECRILPFIGKYLQVPFEEYLEEQKAKMTKHSDHATLVVSCLQYYF